MVVVNGMSYQDDSDAAFEASVNEEMDVWDLIDGVDLDVKDNERMFSHVGDEYLTTLGDHLDNSED